MRCINIVLYLKTAHNIFLVIRVLLLRMECLKLKFMIHPRDHILNCQGYMSLIK